MLSGRSHNYVVTGSNSSTVEFDQGGVNSLASLEQTQSSSKSQCGTPLDSGGEQWQLPSSERGHQTKLVNQRCGPSSVRRRLGISGQWQQRTASRSFSYFLQQCHRRHAPRQCGLTFSFYCWLTVFLFYDLLSPFCARQQNASRVLAMAWVSASACLPVCPSVTLWICIKTVQAKITKSLLWAAPRILVSCDKILCSCAKGFPSNEGVKKGTLQKDVIWPLLALVVWKRLQISTNMLLIITSTGHGLFSFTNINNLDRPWTPKIRGFRKFFLWLRAAPHILRVNCAKWLEINPDNLHMKFSALNVDFSSPSPDPLSSRRPAHASVKEGYSRKSGYIISRVAWKWLQIGADILVL